MSRSFQGVCIPGRFHHSRRRAAGHRLEWEIGRYRREVSRCRGMNPAAKIFGQPGEGRGILSRHDPDPAAT